MFCADTEPLARVKRCPITSTIPSGKLPSPRRIVPMKMTESRYEALDALMPEGRYLLRRDSAKLTRADRMLMLIRTNIIELVGHREKKIAEIKGQTAAWLLKEQAIEAVEGIERPAHGELFKITDHGRAAVEECKRLMKGGADAPWHKKPRVTERMVASLAGRYDCTITFNVARRWYELQRMDNRELQMPTICHPKTKRHVRRLGDMTNTEWSAAIAKAAVLKEPTENDKYPTGADKGIHS